MRRREDRPVGAFVVTAIIHVAVLVVLTSVLRVPVLNLLRYGDANRRDEQVITFYTSPPEPTPPPRATPRTDSTRAQADAAVTPLAGAPPVVAPTVVPTVIAQGGRDTTGADTLARRGVRGDPLAGLRPGVTDPRLRGVIGLRPTAPAGAVRAPRTDSIGSIWVATYWDSVARAQMTAERPNTDWTIRRGDSRYGIDPAYIYFGKYKLPTALLALLPISTQANPTVWERNRALNAMREDIMYHATRAQNEDDFNASVRRIHDRIEQERAAKKAEQERRNSGRGGDGRD